MPPPCEGLRCASSQTDQTDCKTTKMQKTKTQKQTIPTCTKCKSMLQWRSPGAQKCAKRTLRHRGTGARVYTFMHVGRNICFCVFDFWSLCTRPGLSRKSASEPYGCSYAGWVASRWHCAARSNTPQSKQTKIIRTAQYELAEALCKKIGEPSN